ncbi:MAG TPA: FAD-dependent oxidoreductase, partial [Acidimicrobiia bacterium]
LGLGAAGVEVDSQGRIQVDATLQSTNPSVFAAGDVTAHPQFVYVAARGGSIAAENALRGTSRKIDFGTMPRVTFTTPSVASVGMTEAEALDAGHRVMTSILPLDVVPRALVDHAAEGLVKLVADEVTGRLLGAHVLAEGAGDVIQAAVMALRYRATVDEIADTYHPYLTMAEALKLAAQGFRKDPRTLSCCAA